LARKRRAYSTTPPSLHGTQGLAEPEATDCQLTVNIAKCGPNVLLLVCMCDYFLLFLLFTAVI